MALSDDKIQQLVLTPEREIQLADDVVKTNAAYLEELENLKYRRFIFLKAVFLACEAGFTRQEVGDILGISRQRVSLLIKDYYVACGKERIPPNA